MAAMPIGLLTGNGRMPSNGAIRSIAAAVTGTAVRLASRLITGPDRSTGSSSEITSAYFGFEVGNTDAKVAITRSSY